MESSFLLDIMKLLLSASLTHALALIVLVDEDVVQDEVEQLVLQSAVWVEDQRLEAFSAAGDQLVTEDHQQVTEKHERLSRRHKEEAMRRPEDFKIKQCFKNSLAFAEDKRWTVLTAFILKFLLYDEWDEDSHVFLLCKYHNMK